MNRVTFSLVVLGVCGMMTACSNSKQVQRAPQNQQETGIIVQTSSAEEMGELVSLSDSYRVISEKHNVYEIKGLTAEEIKGQVPSASVDQNHYYKSLTNKKPKAVNYMGLVLNEDGNPVDGEPGSITAPAPDPLVEGCNPNALPRPQVDLQVVGNTLMNTDTLNLGETAHFSAAGSTGMRQSEEPIEIRWELTPPGGSEIQAGVSKGTELEVKTDMVGLYMFIVLAKQGEACAGMQAGFLVTHNPEVEYATADENRPTMDLTPFSQLDRVQAHQAWDSSTGEGVVIAVLDTGLQYNHPAIKFSLATNEKERNGAADSDNDNNGFANDVLGWDFVNGDNKPFDDEGHGSHVSGLAASHIFGVANGAKVLPVKVMNAAGGGDTASIIAGIYYAADNGAHVINASLGGALDEVPALIKAIEYAHSRNVVFIAASGNSTLDLSDPEFEIYPGELDIPNVVNVAALGVEDTLASYSNFGQAEVDVAAPGGDMGLPLYSLATFNPMGVEFVGSGGTSMAAPVVAGIAALVLQANPNLTTEEVRQILMTSGQEVDALTSVVGSGRAISAFDAVKKAEELNIKNQVF